jgi:natural product biosynthesis luciferase-like monooxygenase protein
MNLGVMFFSSHAGDGDRYAIVEQAAQLADRAGFVAVWTPERHFDPFGGLFPNPAVLSAALAKVTDRIQIRAGSIVSPLHDPIRIAEDWSVVDNLSGGRVALSFGSGWNADDFVLQPRNYETRRDLTFDQIELVRRLWRGETVVRENGAGATCEVRIYPTPVQPELPVWVTSSGSRDTFVRAGAIGANVLTHLVGQDLDSLADAIAAYRSARADGGFDPATGVVSLMLHTYVDDDPAQVRAAIDGPLRTYLRSALRLEYRAAAGGPTVSGNHRSPPARADDELMDEMLDLALERYAAGAAMIGSTADCTRRAQAMAEADVDEIACLIDFGIGDAQVLAGLERLTSVRVNVSPTVTSSRPTA